MCVFEAYLVNYRNSFHFLKARRIDQFFFLAILRKVEQIEVIFSHNSRITSTKLPQNCYLNADSISAQPGNMAIPALWQMMAVWMTQVSCSERKTRSACVTRKTRTTPMKTTARLSSWRRRAWWLIVACWFMLWRRRDCRSLISL